VSAIDVREFWTPTRPLFKRKPLSLFGEWYDLYPGDLLTHDDETGVWTKVAPGVVIDDVRVDVFLDNLQAVRVHWIGDAQINAFVWLATEVDVEEANERLDKDGQEKLREPMPVPVWPEVEEEERPQYPPWMRPFWGQW
jgi:hypothetical protein